MKQEQFIATRQARWDNYRESLKRLRARRRPEAAGDFPVQYRRLCNDMALARTRGYSLGLVRQLQQWILEGHAFLYRPRASLISDTRDFFNHGFPALVRMEWRLTLVCTLLLFGPILWMFWQIGTSPEFVYRVLDPQMVQRYEQMYARPPGSSGSAESELFMFAFYIFNNIGVALRTFAGGLLFGVGSIFVLLFNGLHIGAVAAHLSFEGYQENFASFVIGHGALELPAIVLAGVAGMRMGWSLVAPGQLGRLSALRASAASAVRLLYGVMAMLLLAAGLEAFWSASTVAAEYKYVIGALLWLLVIAYFLLAGRRRKLAETAHAD